MQVRVNWLDVRPNGWNIKSSGHLTLSFQLVLVPVTSEMNLIPSNLNHDERVWGFFLYKRRKPVNFFISFNVFFFYLSPSNVNAVRTSFQVHEEKLDSELPVDDALSFAILEVWKVMGPSRMTFKCIHAWIWGSRTGKDLELRSSALTQFKD